MKDPDIVRIFDTTLRDGEQSPGATMTRDEKLRIARQLDALGVDVIEAGFPVASQGEREAVRRIASVVERAEVAGLCRTREGDIDAAWDALKDAANPRLHVFIATSDIHLEHKLRMSREEVLEEIRRGVSACAARTPNVEFSAEDATRSDLAFLKEAFACAVESGATVLNIPDTVGYTMPVEYHRIVTAVREMLGDRDDVIISTHCHDDLGLAVANSLAAVAAGARQIECCVNGIGERAGNASLEEVAMAIRTRRDLLGCDTRLDTTKLVAVSRLVSEVTGMLVPPNKAIVGRNAFSHESGIHQHGVLSERTTYEIMAPEDVGFTASNLVLGKHSGKHALRDRLKALGYEFAEEQMRELFQGFKELTDRKKVIYDEDLHALVANTVLAVQQHYALDCIEFTSGSDVTPRAAVTVRIGDETAAAEAGGDGPVNAAIEAIKKATRQEDVELEGYTLTAVTGGSDAQGRVHVLIRKDGLTSRGQGTHTDVVVASARAFVHALNHHLFQEELRRLGAGVQVPRSEATV
ncbi:MAG: 2-isopropylmalate synthase [Myxococcota bacterium]